MRKTASYLRTSLALLLMCAAALGTAACTSSGASHGGTYTPRMGQAGKHVMWVPTSQALVDHMLDMAKVTPQDYLVDLGSGDGRLVISAAKQGVKAHGIEFNPDLVVLSRQTAVQEGVADRATFERADIFKSEFSDATVITLFLLPDLNVRLMPTLLNMKPGTRIVSNTFDMADWRPDESATVTEGCSGFCTAHMWVVPAEVAGTWRMGDKQLELKQTFQYLRGSLRNSNSRHSIRDGRMVGTQVEFSVGNDSYIGHADGDEMHGTVNGSRPWSAVRIQ